jgi:hypothetical protein
MVDSYRNHYGDREAATLSAIDLTKVTPSAEGAPTIQYMGPPVSCLLVTRLTTRSSAARDSDGLAAAARATAKRHHHTACRRKDTVAREK